MPLHNVGDKVVVDGIAGVIRSWPADDNGVFVVVTTDPNTGAENYRTLWISNTKVTPADQVNVSADVTLLEAHAGAVQSTAGKLDPEVDFTEHTE